MDEEKRADEEKATGKEKRVANKGKKLAEEEKKLAEEGGTSKTASESAKAGQESFSARDWHIRMANCYREAIGHLQRSSQDARVDCPASTVPWTAQCQSCAFTKAPL